MIMSITRKCVAAVVCLIGIATAGGVKAADDQPTSSDADAAALSEIVLPKSDLDNARIEALDEAVEAAQRPQQKVAILKQRAVVYMRAQQWSQAARAYEQAANLQPEHSGYWMRAAVLLHMAKNAMLYDQYAQQMLDQFKATSNPYDGERTAKICWLPKQPVEKRELAEKLSDLSLKEGWRPWGQFFHSTRALGHYRYEEYDEALEALAESNRLNATKSRPRDDLVAINHGLEALCLARLDRIDDAQAALAKANKAIREAVKHPDLLYTTNYWHDWLIAKLMHEEARELIAKATKDNDASVEEAKLAE